MRGDDAPGRLDAIDAGHVEVHHDDVRLLFCGEAYRLLAVGGLTHDGGLRQGGEQGAQALAEDRMVIGEEHAQRRGHAAASGRWAVNWVPPLSRRGTSQCPPSYDARAGM